MRNKSNFESHYKEEPQIAISGTRHTVTTMEKTTLHRKHINKPITTVEQEETPRRQLNRYKDGKFEAPQTSTVAGKSIHHQTHCKS